MSLGSIRKKGYLFKLPVKGLVKKWNRRWFVLYATSHEGVIRMEYFDSEACERGALGKRTIPLRDCSGIKQTVGDKTHPYVFELQSQIGHHVFACDTQPDLDEWMEGIKEALHEDKMKRRQKKTQSLVINRDDSTDYSDNSTLGRKTSAASYLGEIEEGTYRVTMEQNETATKMALQGEYNLNVSKTSLSLVGANSGATIAEWHFKFLKNYGKQHGRFHFETGKSSPTGAGHFMCVTTCAKEIFGVVHRNIKQLRTARESERKESLEKQVEEAKASQQKLRSGAKAAPLRKQHSAPDTRFSAQNKRSSKEIAGQPTTGKYRSSKDFDEQGTLKDTDVENHYSLATEADDFDPSHVYSVVNKPMKQSVTKQHQAPAKENGPPPKPKPYSLSSTDTKPPTNESDQPTFTPFDNIPPPVLDPDTNRYSLGSARDSRDSALIQLTGNFLGSLDEQDEMLSPLMTGVNNPMGNESFVVPEKTEDLINFDIPGLDDNFFEKLEQLDTEDGELAGTGGASGRPNPAEERLDQQQFDQLWNDIFSTLPSTSEEPGSSN